MNFKELVKKLLELSNHPEKREGYQKALFIQNWFAQNNVEAEIVPVDNLDSTRDANKDNKWYVVDARVGTDKEDGINGIIAAHHDQITVKNIQYKQENGITFHPWIQDDTVQVAAAMFAFVKFSKWWQENKVKLNLRGCVRCLITDGEEVNTLGMRGILKKWKEEGNLKPLDFLILGESTGKVGSPFPGIAYVNRGKGMGNIYPKTPSNLGVLISDYFLRFRLAQNLIYSKAMPVEYSNDTLNPSTLSTTFLDFNFENKSTFWEIRSNEIFDAKNSIDLLKKVFDADMQKIEERCGQLFGIGFQDSYAVNASETYSLEGYRMHVVHSTTYHPGVYNPLKNQGVYAALELLLSVLSDYELENIRHIELGSKSATNTVPNSAVVDFNDNIDVNNIIYRLNNIEDNKDSIVNFYKNLLNKKQIIEWDVVPSKEVPTRETLGNFEDNEWLVKIAQEKIKQNCQELFPNKEIEIPINVFNAMNDSGPTTYPEYYSTLWAKGENVMTIGVGAFSRLHKNEQLSQDEWKVGEIQYQGLLEEIVKYLAGEKRD